METLSSRLGGPMNLGLQYYTISMMAISRNIDDMLPWEDLDLDPTLRLPENWDEFFSSWKANVEVNINV